MSDIEKQLAEAQEENQQLKNEEMLEFSFKPDWEASAVSITRIS